MHMILNSRSGADGVLHLAIPVSGADRDFHVEVTVRDPDAFVLPEHYFDVLGSIADATFERPPQGESPEAVTFE